MADKLTPQQKMAVENRGGRLLVSAAAGSGKTKVLVDRLLSYLTDPVAPANLDDFLIITYTKAAAAELRGKITEKLTERIAENPESHHLHKQMQRLYLTKISTVHGFCGDILREYAYQLDIPGDFRVADENECAELRAQVLEKLLEEAYLNAEKDPAFLHFMDTQGLGRDDRVAPQLIEQVYDAARCHLDPMGWLEKCMTDLETGELSDASETIWGKYLMDDLMEYLDIQIPIMERCTRLVDPDFPKILEGMERITAQLRHLRSAAAWDQVVERKDVVFKGITFVKNYPDKDTAERIKAAKKACQEGLEKKLKAFSDASAQVLEDLAQTSRGTVGLVNLVKAFSRRFDELKRSRRVLDFGDLEHRTLDLLLGKRRSGPTQASVEIGQRFREIMVDEYQDSNAVQDAIFDALTRRKQNCFLVGDVKQSIYQFRLADPGIFLEKYQAYVSAEAAAAGEGRKVLLSHNFRSGGEVVEAVNDVFSQCMSPEVGGLWYTDAEALREGIPHQALPGAVELHAIDVREDTYAEEAAAAAQRIRQMLHEGAPVRTRDGQRPVQPEDIVILLRSPKSSAGPYVRALEALGIRCDTGGAQNLMRSQELVTLRAILQVIHNPRQDIPLVAALASPVFGFTANDLADLRGGRRAGTIYEALLQWDNPRGRAFLEILNTLRLESGRKPLSQLLERCFTLTRMDSIYAAMDGGEARFSNLQSFYRLAADYEALGSRSLGQFLEYLDTMEDKDLLTAAPGSGGAVTIMSIHKSKGLEFPVVFLCGLSRKFNLQDMTAQIQCHQDLGIGMPVVDSVTRTRYPSLAKRAITVKKTRESVSEELRVLYVAMTRARDRLVMTYAKENLGKNLQKIADRMTFDPRALCQEAGCPGHWVMMTALGRIEAGALFETAGNPGVGRVSDQIWNITVEQAPETADQQKQEEAAPQALPPEITEQLRTALGFSYPHSPATQAPSKQTATGRKGREKDEEAAQDTQQPRLPRKAWRSPAFREPNAAAVQAGAATHSAMQYLRYDACGSEAGIQQELDRMTEKKLLTLEQRTMVDSGRIAAFFRSPIGQKLIDGVPHLREFKFSILDEGSRYGQGLEGEQVLLQGVVDCALLEEEGITVVDFKTDRVTEASLDAAVSRYRLQVQTYSDALSRIFEMPVKQQLLYFFHLDRFVQI